MFRKLIRILLLVGLGVGIYVAYPNIKLYMWAYKANTTFDDAKKDLFIPSNSTQEDVFKILEDGYVRDIDQIKFVASRMNYIGSKVVAGKYVLMSGMTNKDIITELRGGYGRKEVSVTFNTIRLKHELAKQLAENIEATEEEILNLLNDESFVSKYGFTPETVLTMFLPDTYRMQWNTSAEELMQRMADEYKKFWNEERKQKAVEKGLSQSKVAILASIVQAEQSRRRDEQPRIAGLYLNRIRVGMPLQSDPTLIFALGNFSINRVLNVDKDVESPYNTYKYAGLPPGPINLPEISALDAVLNAEQHNYLYMCAKPDFSGYHNFATSYAQHMIYAREFQRALNKRNIKR
ncbi:MAG: endolytic transglycosylase MltG [Bacteroidia bacterium]